MHQSGSAQNDSTNGSHPHNAVDSKASAKRSNHGYVNLPMTFNGEYKDCVLGNGCLSILGVSPNLVSRWHEIYSFWGV